MLGCRAIYHDGWKAVAFHPMVGFAYDGQRPERAVRRGPVGAVPRRRGLLRDREPGRRGARAAAALVELWWSEAERNQVLPLTNRPGRHGDRRHRHERYEYGPGIGVLPNALAPNLRNRGFRIRAELDLPAGGADGVLVTHGGASGGYALYLQDGRVHWTYNRLGADDHDGVQRRRCRPGRARSG